MKLLLDSCVWGKAKDQLIAAGHDVIWSGDWDEDPGDELILAQAYADERILVTLDKDFGELAFLHNIPHHGIIRIVNHPARVQSQICLEILNKYGEEVLRGAIVTAEPGRLRIRPSETFDEDGDVSTE